MPNAGCARTSLHCRVIRNVCYPLCGPVIADSVNKELLVLSLTAPFTHLAIKVQGASDVRVPVSDDTSLKDLASMVER